MFQIMNALVNSSCNKVKRKEVKDGVLSTFISNTSSCS